MKTIVEILESLEADNSRLAKEAILEEHVNHELLKAVFTAATDPYVNYGVSKFKMPKPKVRVSEESELLGDLSGLFESNAIIDEFLILLRRMNDRELTGNAARAAVESKFSEMTELEQKWCHRILLRNMRCGVSTNIIEKTWPGLVKSFSVSLAVTLDVEIVDGKVVINDDIKYPIWVDPKLDGFRCIVIKRNGEVLMFSRNGKPLTTLPTIKKAIENAPIDNIVLDGEAMCDNWETSASILLSSKNIKNDDEIKLHVFDAMSFDEWTTQSSDVLYGTRIDLVTLLVKKIDHKNVVKVEGFVVHDQNELENFYVKCLDEDYEGIMLKDLNEPYHFERSKAVYKFKPVTTHELIVVSAFAGRENTKRAGQFGGFNGLSKDGVITRVGGGWKDPQRVAFQLEGVETFVGKIMEVEGQGITPDGKVRFPRFLRWREECDVDPAVVEAYNTFVR